ncbi:hypothetical protein GCM10023225_06840 [Kineococcus glutinatus]|uniref:DUF6318 domain-containing protein n=1 Tax=Kineococcus glutinatus TaxID=1070872 RepID=A0ABP9HBE3_9ACTN
MDAVPPSEVTALPDGTELVVPQPALVGQEAFSREGALDFVAYYVQLMEYAYTTNDHGLLRSVSEDVCEYCAIQVEEIDGNASRGNHFGNLELWFREAMVEDFDEATGLATLTFSFGYPPYQLVDAAGQVLKDFDAVESETLEADLHWAEGRWRVQYVEHHADVP